MGLCCQCSCERVLKGGVVNIIIRIRVALFSKCTHEEHILGVISYSVHACVCVGRGRWGFGYSLAMMRVGGSRDEVGARMGG